jgi:uncharacterized protein (DUF1330 family)
MTKPAFMIFGVDVQDMDKFGQYAQGTIPLLEQFGVTVLSATNDIDNQHGNWSRERVTVLKFPSMDQARALWASPDYAPLKALRESCSQSDILLIEGMTDEDPDAVAADTGSSHYVLGFNDMLNADWVPEYQAKVPPIAAKWNLTMPCSGDGFEVLDGNFPRQTMVLLQFESKDAYQGFWFDPDYLPIKKLREDNTDSDHIAFAGGFDPI